MIRPYFRESIDSLRKRAESNSNQIPTLREISQELRHRNTRAARILQVEVILKLLSSSSEYFPWPDTKAPPGDGELDDEYFQFEQGVLKFMGYETGKTKGLSDRMRREILDDVFCGALPRINNSDYMMQWGTPRSSTRLRKMAESLATFSRNQKRRTSPSTQAICDWESDLEYLKYKYYVGHYDFSWPSTSV